MPNNKFIKKSETLLLQGSKKLFFSNQKTAFYSKIDNFTPGKSQKCPYFWNCGSLYSSLLYEMYFCREHLFLSHFFPGVRNFEPFFFFGDSVRLLQDLSGTTTKERSLEETKVVSTLHYVLENWKKTMNYLFQKSCHCWKKAKMENVPNTGDYNM